MTRISTKTASLLLLAASATAHQIVFDNNKSQAGTTGAVASESKECSEIGRSILEAGGNAVDSLVSTVLCVGVIGMYHSGIGGGGFLLVRDANGTYEAIDFRETAPAAAAEDMYRGNVPGSVYGGLAVAVPGELRGLQYAHDKYGALAWKDVVLPAARVARDGFRVSSDLVRYMDNALITRGYNFLVHEPEWAQDFAPNGTLLVEGDIMTRKRYADTLETIAVHGADAFYTGAIAESMVRTIQASNGSMTEQDLRDYKIALRAPLSVQYRNHTLYTVGAPASGAICLSNLKIMEQYDVADWADEGLSVHRFDEAMRYAYGARMQFGDPAFVEGVAALETMLLQDETARTIHSKISDNATKPVDAYDPLKIFTAEGQGTSHIVTADKSGMATTLTTTINLLFGAQLMDPRTGIILNDEMNDFSIPGVPNEFGFAPSPSNFIRPGKRPLSSVTPVIVDTPSGQLFLAVGAAGGSRIISSTTQVLWHVLEHNMTMADALARPRQHDQLLPNWVTFEYTFDNATVHAMRQKGHHVKWVREGFSAVQGIRREADGVFEPASEPRQKNSGGVSV